MFVCVYACQAQPGCIGNTWTHGVWEYDAKEKSKNFTNNFDITYHMAYL